MNGCIGSLALAALGLVARSGDDAVPGAHG